MHAVAQVLLALYMSRLGGGAERRRLVATHIEVTVPPGVGQDTLIAFRVQQDKSAIVNYLTVPEDAEPVLREKKQRRRERPYSSLICFAQPQGQACSSLAVTPRTTPSAR